MSQTRREFIKASLSASTLMNLGLGSPAAMCRSALAAAQRRGSQETILVVLQLAGGNDGLNTIIPYADDEYYRKRPVLSQAAQGLHKIDDLLGFHRETEALKRLYDDGNLSVIQGVGYPNPDGSHGRSMRFWQTAKPHDDSCQTGWVGRAADWAFRPEEANVPAIFVGPGTRSFALNAASAVVPAASSSQQYKLHAMPIAGVEHRRCLSELADLPRTAHNDPLLEHLRRSTAAAWAAGARIEAVARSAGPARGYPDLPLAGVLSNVAQLIRAELGIRIFFTEMGGAEPGGFDTHAKQLGNHGVLLRQLSESVAAFANDLARDRLLERVLLMTFSEFGRTVAENGRHGTNHGSAAPVFLVGGMVKGGLVGAHPDLTDLEGTGQKHHTDFRRVYATVLERWLGFDSGAVLGSALGPLDVLRA